MVRPTTVPTPVVDRLRSAKQGRPHAPGQVPAGEQWYECLWRKEEAWVEVPQPEIGAISRKERRLIDHRHDPAGNQVPILIEADRDDGLNIEGVLGVIELANAEVRIVLKRHTDQTGDGVLRCFTQAISTLGASRGRRT